MIEQGMDAAKLIKDAVTYLKNSGQQTKIIAASIRSVAHIELVASSGSDIVTVSPKLLLAASTHPMTEAGNQEFWGS
jgi:transaldolase